MLNNFGRKIFSELSLKSSRSAPIIVNNPNHKILISSKLKEKNNSSIKKVSSLSNVKSAVELDNHTNVQKSQQDLDAMHKIVDRTDNDLRQALEYASLRREQLDELHFRSEEMLSKNENLVFGITNFRKTQERDLLWRRLRYVAFGAITIGIIILLVILSMTSRRSASSSQVIDVRHINDDSSNTNNKDITSTVKLIVSRRRRREKELLTELNEYLSSKSEYFLLSDNNL
ncbi:unnamed protein product [Rotaria sp. Silwood2]|nr:unnamed protein product [Rotaria sp. Silwood2]CAF2851888.1 unnamed protein product [Rotaria sp. Silwood2]CAF3311411.1 unnamed protein product [Rotaria sp. Silwood2]CAF4062350.1 unnamed protein product [Rotaria sp. Silwood2]CAF4166090.1 unnamed protein product [Rotaria sp. Silwood2]